MENKNILAITKNTPTTVDDLNIVEVLDVEFGIKCALINDELILPEGTAMPTDEEIATAKENLLAKYNTNLYGKYRAVEYPNIKEQLDMLYHDIVSGNLTAENSTFVASIASIKNKYPKSE
jgi:hypothetical protein